MESVMSKNGINDIIKIYNKITEELDKALIGQARVKKTVASALLCDSNSKILFTGSTGMGKTTITNFLASSFNTEKISVTSDLIPTDILNQLSNKQEMNFLQIEEFNRASGKVQSAFIELFADHKMTYNGTTHNFKDFYVFASQNNADVAGIFNVPSAVYDRFDLNIYFDHLTDSEKRAILFSDFTPSSISTITLFDLKLVQLYLKGFKLKPEEEELMLEIFNLIDNLTLNNSPAFAGSNIRAHKYALKLVKLNAIIHGRDYLLSSDIIDFFDCLYMHRLNQNITEINSNEAKELFASAKNDIKKIRRHSKFF